VDDTAPAAGPADPPTDAVAWHTRPDRTRAVMAGLRQDTARVSTAVTGHRGDADEP
jgi:hypothetical protein